MRKLTPSINKSATRRPAVKRARPAVKRAVLKSKPVAKLRAKPVARKVAAVPRRMRVARKK